MAVVTNTEVFNFMGTPADVKTNQGTWITQLIAEMTKKFEEITGRKAESTAFTDVLLTHGLNCEIYGNTMYLKGMYRDTYSLSAFSEDGTALSAATGPNSDGYTLDTSLGIIKRVGANFLKTDLAYKMTGKLGLVNSDDSVRDDIKNIIIEMVAAKSGLWKSNVQTVDGTIETIRTQISEDAQKQIERFTLRDV